MTIFCWFSKLSSNCELLPPDFRQPTGAGLQGNINYNCLSEIGVFFYSSSAHSTIEVHFLNSRVQLSCIFPAKRRISKIDHNEYHWRNGTSRSIDTIVSVIKSQLQQIICSWWFRYLNDWFPFDISWAKKKCEWDLQVFITPTEDLWEIFVHRRHTRDLLPTERP